MYRAFLGRVEARIRRMLAFSSGGVATNPTSGTNDAQDNLAALERIVETIRQRNGTMIIVMLPNTDAFEAQRPLFAPFTNLCDRNDWRCVNLLDDFIASGVDPSSLQLNLLDGHPNERYHAIVAEALSRSVLPLLRNADVTQN